MVGETTKRWRAKIVAEVFLMGVGSLLLGVGSLLLGVSVGFLVTFAILQDIERFLSRRKFKRSPYSDNDDALAEELSKFPEFELVNNFRARPDDPLHPYATLRAWDRHLKLHGLPPIGTKDPDKVGPILQDPNGEYIVFGYNELGHLTSWRRRAGML